MQFSCQIKEKDGANFMGHVIVPSNGHISNF